MAKGSQLQIKVNEAYVDGIYDRLAQMQVNLDADPLAYGPKRLNEKTAQVRAHLSGSERIFTQISGDLALLKRELRKNQAAFELQRNDLMANDPKVRAGQTQAIRDAMVSNMLRPLIEEITTLDSSIAELEAVLVVVKAKRSDLRDTKAALRDQLKLCQEELGLGSAWGKKLPPLDPGEPYVGDQIDELVENLDGEIHLQQKADGGNGVGKPADRFAPTASPEEIEAFLRSEGIEPSADGSADPVGDDFDEMFGDTTPPAK